MIAIVSLVFISIVALGITYKVNISPVDSSDSTKIEVVIPSNTSTKEIGKILKENDLIRSSTFFNIYVKLFKVEGLQSGSHSLSKDMNLEEILEELKKKDTSSSDSEIKIKFTEGINIRQLANKIAETTNNSYDDVMKLVNDEEYIDELIKKYWFITEDIKNDELYYKLEGYLFPDTYFYKSKDVSVKVIFAKMLTRTDEILSKYKDDITEKNLSVHYILTLASIIEKEGKTRDFKDISSVFYNRIDSNMKFESCATAIYGAKKEFSDIQNRVITDEVMKVENAYNTYYVQIPVGPICLPGEEAIEAAINPSDTKYLFFLSDNRGITYFFNTYSEHQQKQRELVQAGKWN